MKRPWYTAYTSLEIVIPCGGMVLNVRYSLNKCGRNHAFRIHWSGVCVKSPSWSYDQVTISLSSMAFLKALKSADGLEVSKLIAILFPVTKKRRQERRFSLDI